MRVLLVDDEREFVTTLAERLSLRGVEADWADSGEGALKLAEVNQYDVAVLDVKMPRIGGFKIKKLLQKKRPDMKYIFLTGHGSEEDYKEGLSEAGIDFYLIKPVNIERLIEKMREAVKAGKEIP